MSLQQKIDRITDILRRDDGISGAMHYTEQTSWVLFLKFLDDYESEKEDEAVLSGKDYQPVLDEAHRWSNWACPKDEDGKLDINKVRTGDDLTEYVNTELFPYLKSFANAAAVAANPKTFSYKIGAIFQFLDNKIASGHTLREVLDLIDTLNFQSSDEMFELSLVYEGLLQNMGDAGGYAGEFYTPRPVVRAMVKAVDPQPLDKIYDAAAGSCGFLVDAFEYNLPKSRKERGVRELTSEEYDFQRLDAYWGFEKTSLAYVMGMMNMILHGIESPNLFRGNTLTQNIRDIQEKDRYNIILANPPFGGKEKPQIQQNFPIQANATELLFLQHFMKTLKSGGKAAIVIPEGVLFQTNSAFKQVKQELLDNFNLHTVLSLPAGVFLPYSGVKTNVLFFERSGGTSDVWYYECEPEQKLTKNKPITDEHLNEFIELYNSRETTERSWTVSASKLAEDYDLSAKNPAKQKDAKHLAPIDILKTIRTKERLVSGLLDEIEDLLAEK
jgi:type I restriction enzyme M protein|tara:strand:- start:60200 stop:61696 length:1497 start_codon:yes stop_codon:yes gene_type:complete